MKPLVVLLTLLWWMAAAGLPPASAQTPCNILLMGVGGGCAPSQPSAYTGPGDVTSFTAWYSCTFAYSSAVASPGTNTSCNIRNTSTNETCDILIATTGSEGNVTNCSVSSDGLSVATFCALGCAVTAAYDQTNGNACGGSSCSLVQSTAADQPTLLLSCISSMPCIDYTSQNGAMFLEGAHNITPASGNLSFEVVAQRLSTTSTGSPLLRENGSGANNRMTVAVNSWSVGAGTVLSATATDNTTHYSTAVSNGASSIINIDGTETTGTASGTTAAGEPSSGTLTGTASSVFYLGEGGFADNVAFSSGTRSSLVSNAQTRW